VAELARTQSFKHTASSPATLRANSFRLVSWATRSTRTARADGAKSYAYHENAALAADSANFNERRDRRPRNVYSLASSASP
jgi:hypothetical protein